MHYSNFFSPPPIEKDDANEDLETKSIDEMEVGKGQSQKTKSPSPSSV